MGRCDYRRPDRCLCLPFSLPLRRRKRKRTGPFGAARTLRTLCDSIHNLCPAPHILIMGDFNDTPDDTSIREILDAHPIPNPCLSGSGSMPMKPRTNAYPSLLLYNLFAKNRSVPPGSHKYQGEWSQLDQIILSSSLTDTTSQIQLIPGSARIFSPSFLLIKDKTWRGERPFRTYYGFKYEGGYSDHLPLIVDFLLLK